MAFSFAGFDQDLPITARAKQRALAAAAGAQKPRGRGGFLSSLISEAGGTGGALGGAALGSAILPGIGTLAGALIGGFAGGTGGRLAENKIRDDEFRLGDALEEGVLSGVMGAGPIRLAKTAGAGVKAAATGAGKLGLREALERGATGTMLRPVYADGGEAIAKAGAKTAKTSVAGRLEDLGNKALQSQYGTISKPVARATRPLETIGQLADFGVTKPADAERIASAVTGANGIINKAVVTSVGGANRVSTKGVMKVLDDAIADVGVVGADAKSLRTTVGAKLGRLGKGSDAEPGKVLSVMKDLEKRIADLSGKGSNYRLTDPKRLDQAKALRAVKNELEERLYTGAGANKHLSAVLTPEFRQNLVSLQPGNKKWQTFIDDQVMKSKSVAELRSTMAPFVRINQIIDEGDINALTFGGRLGNAFGFKDALVGAAAKTAGRPAGTALRGAGKAAAGKAGVKMGPYSAKNTALRVGAGSALLGPLLSSGETEAMPDDTLGLGMNDPMANDATMPLEGELVDAGGATSASPFSVDEVEAGVERILASGGSMKDASDYVSLVSALQKVRSDGTTKTKPLTGEARNRALKAESGLRSLDTLEGVLASDPGAFQRQALPNPLGITARVTGTTDVRAATDNLVDVIARMRSGAAITDSEAKRFARLLPQPGDSQESAQRKLEIVRAELESYLDPSNAGPTLEDLLTAQGAFM